MSTKQKALTEMTLAELQTLRENHNAAALAIGTQIQLLQEQEEAARKAKENDRLKNYHAVVEQLNKVLITLADIPSASCDDYDADPASHVKAVLEILVKSDYRAQQVHEQYYNSNCY